VFGLQRLGAGDTLVFGVSSYLDPPAFFRLGAGEDTPHKIALQRRSLVSFADSEVRIVFAKSKDELLTDILAVCTVRDHPRHAGLREETIRFERQDWAVAVLRHAHRLARCEGDRAGVVEQQEGVEPAAVAGRERAADGDVRTLDLPPGGERLDDGQAPVGGHPGILPAGAHARPDR